MSEEVKNPGGEAEGGNAPDPITNIKGEMNRKLGNLESKLAEMTATIQAQLAQMQKPAAAAEPRAQKPLKDLLYDDPEAYARAVTEEATRHAEKLIEERTRKANEQQSILSSLVSEYPELNSMDAELTKLAVEKYKGIGAESPIAYRAAVAEAAAELGVKPKSKRKASAESDGESFSLGGSGGSGKPSRAQSAQVDKAVEALAARMGVSVTPQMRENIKKKLSS
jgi:hypothetical protein